MPVRQIALIFVLWGRWSRHFAHDQIPIYLSLQWFPFRGEGSGVLSSSRRDPSRPWQQQLTSDAHTDESVTYYEKENGWFRTWFRHIPE
jgi:hypothetical protein